MDIVRRLKAQFTHNHQVRELVVGASNTFVLKIFGMASGFAFTFMVSKYLGAEAMGVFSLCLTVITILSILAKFGFDTTLLRLVSEYRAKNEEALAASVYKASALLVLVFSIGLSLAAFAFAEEIAQLFFHKPQLTAPLRIAAGAVVPMAFVFLNAQSLQGLKRIREFAFLQFVAPFFFAALFLLLLSFYERSTATVVRAYVFSALFAGALSFVGVFRHFTFRNSSLRLVNFRELFAISLPMLVSSSVLFLKGWMDTIMLGIMRTEAEVGVYNLALKLSLMAGLALVAVNGIAAPKFAEFYGKRDYRNLALTIRRSTKFIFISTFPLLLIFYAFPGFILGLFGSEFRVGVFAFLVLCTSQFVNAICGSVGYFLQMTGGQVVFQNIVLATAVLNAVLNYFLIPKYGINGAAVSTFMGMLAWNSACVVYIKMKYNILSVYVPWKFVRKTYA